MSGSNFNAYVDDRFLDELQRTLRYPSNPRQRVPVPEYELNNIRAAKRAPCWDCKSRHNCRIECERFIKYLKSGRQY